jgi:hypothetical protein
MMHRSKIPLYSGVREYFNQKRPVNGSVRVVGRPEEHFVRGIGTLAKSSLLRAYLI